MIADAVVNDPQVGELLIVRLISLLEGANAALHELHSLVLDTNSILRHELIPLKPTAVDAYLTKPLIIISLQKLVFLLNISPKR